MQWTRNHLSFANVISVIALFVALGGASYAAVTLPKNSVGPKQIKKRAVRNKHINKNAVSASKIQGNSISSSKIADGSVFSDDLADNSVGASELADNSVGASDLADNSVGSGEVTDGSLGQNDFAPGATLPGHVNVQFTQSGADLANGAEVSIDAQCLAGQTAIGGGVRGDLTNSELTKVTASRPIISPTNSGAPADNDTFTGWRGTFVNENNGAGIRPEVWVICAG
jgi:hypothetical protein